MNKYVKYAAAVALLVVTNIGNWYYTGNMQYKAGMKDYHHLCYFIPGPRLDNEDGTVVYCYPLTQVKPTEKPNKDNIV